MKFFSGTLAMGDALAAGAILVVLACVNPVKAADDLPIVGDIPMPEVNVDVRLGGELGLAPPPSPPPALRAPIVYPRGPFAAIPPARYEADIIDRPAVTPYQVAVMLRSTGYSLLGGINRRGWVYTVAVLNPRGDDGRAIIDARTGAIIRFIPAFAVNARLNDELGVIYGPPGLPPIQDFRRSPRPPLAMPRVSRRDTAPKVASRTPANAPSTTSSIPAASATSAAKPATAPAQQTASTPPKPAEAPEQAKPALVPEAMPATVELQPTKDLPAVQPLD